MINSGTVGRPAGPSRGGSIQASSVSERRGRQLGEHSVLGGEEGFMDLAMAVPAARAAAEHAGRSTTVALDRLDDREEADRSRGPTEDVPTRSTGRRLDQAGRDQVAHDARNEPERDPHLGCDLAATGRQG